MDTVTQTVADRLRKARELDGRFRTATDAAKAHGWVVSTYLGHENGDRVPSRGAAKRYAKAFKVRWEWILEGEGSPRHNRNSQISYRDTVKLAGDGAVNTIAIPEIDLRAGASYAGGFATEEQVIDEFGNSVSRDAVRAEWGFPPPFLRDELQIQPGQAHILPIRGDSMVDSLFDGDRAIIDLGDTDISQGGVFALIDDNGSVIIKQVELLRGKGEKRIRCSSRNRAYKPFILPLIEPVRIIGRVACKITRL